MLAVRSYRGAIILFSVAHKGTRRSTRLNEKRVHPPPYRDVAGPCARNQTRNPKAPSGFTKTSRPRVINEDRGRFCLCPCNVLSCKVPLPQYELAKGRPPIDDFSHSIDYHGAVAVSPVSAARRSNQPVACYGTTAKFRENREPAPGSHGENGYRRGRHQDRADHPAGTAGRQPGVGTAEAGDQRRPWPQ